MGNVEKGLTVIAEKAKVADGPNQPGKGILAECLSDMFEAQVDRTPERTAFVFGASHFSYSELDASANRVARLLIARGVGPESIVGLLLPRSPDLLIALLGIVKAGAAYLPLDPDYPSARLLSMLKDTSASQVLTTADLCGRLQLPDTTPTLLMDQPMVRKELESMPAHQVTDAERLQALRPSNLLYVIYTSGSTGMPKGVAVEHRSFTNLMRAMLARVKMRKDERFLTLTTICFDPAGMEIFLPLLQGSSLEMLNGVDSRDPSKVVEVVERSKINVVAAVPTFWRALIACEIPQTVRAIMGGEALSAEMVPRLLQFPEAINLYGPTETTVCSSFHRIAPEDANAGPVVTVGRPLDGQKFYILDETLSPLPVGQAGELYIAGMGLARGYLNRPELTAQRFLECPFGPPGNRMYRTGDLAQWREDGNVRFLGRADHQVKIRGFRVEPGEIEATLLRLVPSIKECVVVPREICGQVQLVAYYVCGPGSKAPGKPEMRESLAGALPDYMVPGIFVQLERMPLAPNEKLDRQALPQPEESTGRNSFQPPVGITESTICRVFREMTGARQVGRDDDFFQIGGHSLAAVLCIHRLRREFNRDVTLQQLFAARTAQVLARALSSRQENNSVPSRPSKLAYPTIFLVPGMGGDEPRLVRFRMEREGVARIVPLDYPEWTQLLDRNGGMDALVQHFLGQIEEELPHGPVWLLGYSLGGICAHAIALHLAAVGRHVAFLGLLDATATPPSSEVLSAQLQDGATPIQEVWHLLQDIVRMVRAIPHRTLTKFVALTIVRRLTSPWAGPALSIAARYRDARLPLRFNYHLHFYLNEAKRVAAARSWYRAVNEAPLPLSIPAFLFRSESHLSSEPADLGWGRHLPQLEIVNLPGTHETMFEPPHLGTLSDRTFAVIDTLRGSMLTSTSAPS